MITNTTLKNNLEKVKFRIQQEGVKVRIIAVSKKQPISKIQELYRLGIRDFGENYLQEALEKMQSLQNMDIRWHYLGWIQSKKIKDIVERFYLIQSVTRLNEMEKISQWAHDRGAKQRVLVQVNIAGEISKQGVHPGDLPDFLKESLKFKAVQLEGLMVFPPKAKDEAQALGWFSKASDLFEQMKVQMRFLLLPSVHGNQWGFSMGFKKQNHRHSSRRSFDGPPPLNAFAFLE